MNYQAVSFDDLPGWREDDLAPALLAFRASVAKRDAAAAHSTRWALSALTEATNTTTPRAFFETHFTPHRVINTNTTGLLTGYFEPIVAGSRTRNAAFPVPLHRRPADLINLVGEADRGATSAKFTHARLTPTGTEPYATRRDIDQGALDGQELELLYLSDIVDRFIIQVQGSAAIRLPDGTLTRVTYDGKNGHPYTSIGRVLIDQGAISAADMTLDALTSWLKSDLDRARPVIWHNESYVFFRELSADDGNGPLGVMNCALTPGRSLAVDTSHHTLGLPIFVTAPTLSHVSQNPFNRLMIAQDVGSAIKGPERGDIFIGTGDEAGAIAGTIKHPGQFFVLLPNAVTGK